MNRYDNGSVSKFNPLDFKEILLAPTMMRQKHDASIAAAEALRIKADPLDVHLNRAMELKNQMDNEIAKNVDTLNKEGYNSTTFQNITKLNRQYQDLISPTGEVGQINNAKVIYNKEKEEFMKSASNEKIGKDRAELLWKAKTSNYTGYDEDGKKITTVTPQGVAAFQDYDKEKQIAHSILGKTVQGLSSSGHHLEPDGSGGFWEVTRNGERIKSNNTQQIEAAKAAFKQSWLRGEGAKYVRDAGLNVTEQRIDNDFNSMLELSDISKSSESANYNTPPKADESNDGELEGINVEGVDITSNSDMLNVLQGKKTPMEGNGQQGSTAGTFKYDTKKSVNEMLASQEYKQLARSVTRGIPSLVGKDYKSKEVQDAVKKYLEENKTVTIQNKYVDPNVDKTALLFSSKEIPKDKNAASALILERVGIGAYNMVDENGEQISKNDVGKYNFTYSGDMTAKSKVNKFKNPKQNIGARTGVLIDKETGETKTVYVSRSSDDFDTPQYKAMKTINEISGIVDTKPGIYHKLNVPLFKEYGLKNTEIKYNKNSRTYNVSYTDNDGEKVDEQFTDPQFQEWIYNAQNNLNN